MTRVYVLTQRTSEEFRVDLLHYSTEVWMTQNGILFQRFPYRLFGLIANLSEVLQLLLLDLPM